MAARWPVLAAGAVVLSAIAATAHGLFEVAVGCRVPPGIAWLYPVITDGLALVAYSATTKLQGSGLRYAWAVVVLGAGLSGLGQAVYLAGVVEHAPTALRFGVGAWPAVAAAIAAHLLYLLGRDRDVALSESNGHEEAGTGGRPAGKNDGERARAGSGSQLPTSPSSPPQTTVGVGAIPPVSAPAVPKRSSVPEGSDEKSAAAVRSQRSRKHKAGDHSMCLPERCSHVVNGRKVLVKV